MIKYKFYVVILNNFICGNKMSYKEYVDIKNNKKIKKINKKNMYNIRMLYIIKKNKINKK